MSSPRLLDQVRTVARLKHFSRKTEDAYASWIKRFILFPKKRHPIDMAEAEIRQFLAYLAVDLNVSSSTQTVALRKRRSKSPRSWVNTHQGLPLERERWY